MGEADDVLARISDAGRRAREEMAEALDADRKKRRAMVDEALKVARPRMPEGVSALSEADARRLAGLVEDRPSIPSWQESLRAMSEAAEEQAAAAEAEHEKMVARREEADALQREMVSNLGALADYARREHDTAKKRDRVALASGVAAAVAAVASVVALVT